jgi:hypothetical protein
MPQERERERERSITKVLFFLYQFCFLLWWHYPSQDIQISSGGHIPLPDVLVIGTLIDVRNNASRHQLISRLRERLTQVNNN